MSIKSSMMVVMKWTSDRRVQMENVSGGNLKLKGEAQAFERHVLVNYHNKEWLEKPADRRTLTELLGRWWIYHGKSHERGDIERGRLTTIIAKFAEMGVSRADQLTKENDN